MILVANESLKKLVLDLEKVDIFNLRMRTVMLDPLQLMFIVMMVAPPNAVSELLINHQVLKDSVLIIMVLLE